MDRARRLVLSLVLLVILIAGSGSGGGSGPSDLVVPAAAVMWPPSTLLVGEVITGGASASDEYVELTNAGAALVDLNGLEVVYATSTGTTVTRKTSWSSARPLEAGQHLLIANSTGIYAAGADATYSGGLAATGGAIVLRVIGGAPIDSLGWGDATNAFAEGTVAPAPPAKSSLERRPGGSGGSGLDTNDNASDFSTNGAPIAQNLASAPTPAVTPSPAVSASPTFVPTAGTSPTTVPTATPTTTLAPSPAPSLTPEPTPTEAPAASPTASPTAVPMPTPIETPSPTPSPAPTPRPVVPPTLIPTPASTPSPTPVVTPIPTPTPIDVTPIYNVQSLADGVTVTIEGVLTTDLGALESGRTAFVQDGTGGIALYLDPATSGVGGLGTAIRATGAIDSRFSQRTLRVAASDLVELGNAPLPSPLLLGTSAVDESVEGSRVTVSGTVVETPSALADGLGLLIDDGSGPVRIVVTPGALGDLVIARSSAVSVVGPVGQRDSTGAGTVGYRVFATAPGDVVVLPPGSPSPSASAIAVATGDPSPTPTPRPDQSGEPVPSSTAMPAPTGVPVVAPSPTASAFLTPSPSPSPSPSPTSDPVVSLADARLAAVGVRVHVRGVVVAEPSRLGTTGLFPIADATGSIVVRLPAGVATPVRGALVDVLGALAAPYGQLEIRPTTAHIAIVGSASLPLPIAVTALDLGESIEARLVAIEVQLDQTPSRATSGDLSTSALDLATGRRIIVAADASAGIGATDLARGKRLHLVGVIGQRATRVGRLDGYRVWLRDRVDITLATGPTPSPTPTPVGSSHPTPSPSASPEPVIVRSVAEALTSAGTLIRIEATVSAAGTLLDSAGRVVVVQDATAAVAIRLPKDARAPRIGDRLRVDGRIGRAYDAPRFEAIAAIDLGPGAPMAPLIVSTVPGPAHEWRLVRVTGVVANFHRQGDAWRAELVTGAARIAISGVAGASISPSALPEGRRATVVGIVRRPYPTAIDRRFALLPRSAADIRLASAASSAPSSAGGTGSSAASGPNSGGQGAPGTIVNGPPSMPTPGWLDVDVATLRTHLGQRVRIGGIVVSVDPATATVALDDGTAIGRVVLTGDAAVYIALLSPSDALNVSGTVGGSVAAPELRVSAAADLVRVGDVDDLGAGDPTVSLSPAPPDAAVVPTLVDATAGAENDAAPRTASFGLLPSFDGPASAGVGSLVGISLASIAVTLIRRRRVRRAFTARIARRLAVSAGPETVEPRASIRSEDGR